MSDETDQAGEEPEKKLPMVIEQPGERPSLVRFNLPASFIAQLIAEREHLATQRAHRRRPPEEALGAYGQIAEAKVIRMPAGYRHTGTA